MLDNRLCSERCTAFHFNLWYPCICTRTTNDFRKFPTNFTTNIAIISFDLANIEWIIANSTFLIIFSISYSILILCDWKVKICGLCLSLCSTSISNWNGFDCWTQFNRWYWSKYIKEFDNKQQLRSTFAGSDSVLSLLDSFEFDTVSNCAVNLP